MSPRDEIKQLRQQFEEQFNQDIQSVIQDYTTAVDKLIHNLDSAKAIAATDSLCCLAVGGYGRATLLPYSDIDLLILSEFELTPQVEKIICRFIDELWDCGLVIGHNVCQLDVAFTEARHDVTVMTNMLENRLLFGNQRIHDHFNQTLISHQLWISEAFFNAKIEEQAKRYQKYDATSRNLEPDIKYGPGGLRDCQMICWLSQYHYQVDSIERLVDSEFITQTEYQHLISAQQFLMRIAAALQLITKRGETRLLFEHQAEIATRFGFKDTESMLAIEQFMKQYYRTSKRLRQLNDVLLQALREAFMTTDCYEEIDEDFRCHNDYLEVNNRGAFTKNPALIVKLFILLCQHPQIKGVRANTIRDLCSQSHLIDANFRQQHQTLFMQLLKQENLADQLSRMNRYGLLGEYLLDFGNIVGQMQYDLFHVYTVDHHSIITVRNIQRFANPEYRNQFPLCADIYETLSRRDLLIIAGLFHDLGKGKGGDHETIGARQVERFCEHHAISPADTELVTWLVEHHLLLSLTAQRQDIYDPSVIAAFAKDVQDQKHLDYLYCLTVADICATNPSLWNGWRDTLLRDLYLATKAHLTSQEKNINEKDILREKQKAALELLNPNENAAATALWQTFPSTYFLRETPSKISQHAKLILENESIIVKLSPMHAQQYIEIFIYSPIKNAFAITTTILANNHINIVEARLNNNSEGHCLATYIVMPTHHDEYALDGLGQQLKQGLNQGQIPRLKRKRLSRELRHFKRPLKIQTQTDPHRDRSMLQITSGDKPGLLALLSRAFSENDIIVHHAKITTMGDKVEDIFYITHALSAGSLNATQYEALSQQLHLAID